MATDERSIGGFTVDRTLAVRAWDPWMARVTGVPSAAARGRALGDVVPGAEARGLVAAIEEVLAQGLVRVFAPAFHRYLIACAPQRPSPNFSQMQQRVTIGPLREGETIVGAIVTIEDVTERMDRERALARQRREGPQAGAPETPDEFREAIRQDDWRARRQAADAVARDTGAALVTTLLEALRDEHHNFAVVSSALQLLSQLHLDVIEPLAGFLESPDPDLRIQATLGLGEQRDERATPALLHALDDADVNVRFHAIEALGKLRAADAVGRLVEIAHAGDFFLAFAALDALARIGDPRSAHLLLSLLDHELLGTAAVDALGQLGDESTVGSLTALLDKPAPPVHAIAQALVSLHALSIRRYGEGNVIADLVRQGTSRQGILNLVGAANTAHGDAPRALAIVLGWLDGEEVERTLARLLGHANARSEVVEGLVRFGPRVTELLVQQLKSDDVQTRQAAVRALGRIGDRRATPSLLTVLETDPELAVTAAGALAQIGDVQAFERLMAFVAHEDAAVRQAVIAALNSIGHPGMAARVCALLDDPNPRARESAARIAGYFGYPECVDALLARCADEHEEVRRAALEHLAFIDDARATPLLVAALATDTARARAAAAHALGRLDDPRAVGPLVTALADADSWVRYFAARALGHYRRPDAVTPLAGLLGADPAMHVRLAAVEALGEVGTPEAIDVLATVCEEPGDMSAAALRALGATKDPRAWVLIAEALKSADPRRRMEAVRAAAAHGGTEAAVQLEWVAAASSDPAIVAEAVDALARLVPTPGEGGTRALEALVRLTADTERRDASIGALGSLPAAQTDAVASGLNDPRPEVRVAIIEALGRMRQPEATRWLRRALDDAAAEVRKAAIGALMHLGSRGMESKLAALARTDPDPVVRRAASAAVGYRQDDDGRTAN